MDPDKNRLRERKALYIAPLIIGAALAVLVGVDIFRNFNTPPAMTTSQHSLPAKSSPPAVAAPLERADLIMHARDATAQFADTGQLKKGADPLIGRSFHLRIPFGCNGANGAMLNPQTSVSYDPMQDSLTIVSQPVVWSDLPVTQPLLNSGVAEAVEGFWVPRPWTMSEECPPRINMPLPAISTPATTQTLGLAQIFAPGGSRTLRHADHPYDYTRKLGANDADVLNHAYHLVLDGTISGFPDGQSLHCWSEAADHQPICLYAVTIARVSFEDAVTGKTLASWAS